MNALLGDGGGVQVPGADAPQAGGENALMSGGQPNLQQVLAPIMQGATNPDTGEINYNKAFVGLASTPATAPLAGGFLDQAIARGATNVPVALQELEREFVRTRLIGNAAKSLVPLGTNIATADLVRAISSPEFARAVPDPRMRAQILASAPRGGTQLAEWVAQHAAVSEGAVQSMASVMGQLHAKIAARVEEETRGATELLRTPGWMGRAAAKLIEKHPQILQGPRTNDRVGAVSEHLGALREQERAAQEHYSTLAPPGSPPFAEWWEQNLSNAGIL